MPAANNQNSDNQQLNSFIDDAILGAINTHFCSGSISHYLEKMETNMKKKTGTALEAAAVKSGAS